MEGLNAITAERSFALQLGSAFIASFALLVAGPTSAPRRRSVQQAVRAPETVSEKQSKLAAMEAYDQSLLVPDGYKATARLDYGKCNGGPPTRLVDPGKRCRGTWNCIEYAAVGASSGHAGQHVHVQHYGVSHDITDTNSAALRGPRPAVELSPQRPRGHGRHFPSVIGAYCSLSRGSLVAKSLAMAPTPSSAVNCASPSGVQANKYCKARALRSSGIRRSEIGAMREYITKPRITDHKDTMSSPFIGTCRCYPLWSTRPRHRQSIEP